MTEQTVYHNAIKKRYTVYATVKRADGATMSDMPLAHEATQKDAKERVAQIKRDGLGDWTIKKIGYYSEVVEG